MIQGRKPNGLYSDPYTPEGRRMIDDARKVLLQYELDFDASGYEKALADIRKVLAYVKKHHSRQL